MCASYTQVPRADSWITEEQFFAGLAVVQAMPGPLFNLSAYIGALAARRAGVNVLAGIAAVGSRRYQSTSVFDRLRAAFHFSSFLNPRNRAFPFKTAAVLLTTHPRERGARRFQPYETAWFGLFGPGVMLIYGVLPFWGAFRKQPVYRRALPGLNSSAVGLVVAAVFQMSFKVRGISPFKDASVCIGFLAFYAVHFLKVPAPAAILGGGVLGVIAWAAGCT